MNTKICRMKLNELDVEVVQKDIKNVHLSVYPPDGRVKVSAPLSMTTDTLRVYVISRLGWIRKQQAKLRGQKREAPREYIERESHYFNGKRYLLKVIEEEKPARVDLKPQAIELHIRPGTSREKRHLLLSEWYRQQLKEAIPKIISKYEKRMGVEVRELGVKKMRTKWGTCNPEAKRIWINLELAKKPAECLEYIVVHEMAHLLERTHNDRFVKLMNQFMPKWKFYKDELNRLPVSHVEWEY